MNRMLCPVFMTVLIVLGGVSTSVSAEKASTKAQTSGDPELPVDELEIKLRPLMRAQLKVEADAWLKLLEEKVSAISKADIAVKYKWNEIAAAEKLEEALVQLDEAKKNAAKPGADAQAGLSVEEVAEFRQYVTAVSGISVDVTDIEATLKTIGAAGCCPSKAAGAG